MKIMKIFFCCLSFMISSCVTELEPGNENYRRSISEEEFFQYRKDIKEIQFEIYSRKFYLDSILTPKINEAPLLLASGVFLSREYQDSLKQLKYHTKQMISKKEVEVQNLNFCLEKQVSLDRKMIVAKGWFWVVALSAVCIASVYAGADSVGGGKYG